MNYGLLQDIICDKDRKLVDKFWKYFFELETPYCAWKTKDINIM